MTNEPTYEAQSNLQPIVMAELESKLRAADRLADEAAALISLRELGSRTRLADALLDYREPPRTERSDRIAALEAELTRLRSIATLAREWVEAESLWGASKERLAQMTARRDTYDTLDGLALYRAELVQVRRLNAEKEAAETAMREAVGAIVA